VNYDLRTLLSWIPIVAPVLAVLAMILWDTSRRTSDETIRRKAPNHWDRIIELALLTMLVVFGGIQLGINDRQGKITKRQTEIMERQVKLSEIVERPWIAIQGTEILAPLIFTNDGTLLYIKFFLKNTGHIPAAHVLILGKFIFRSMYVPSPDLDAVWKECDQFRTMPLEPRGSGISIFPDQQPFMLYTTRMVSDDVKRLGVRPITGAATFAGCIDYGNDTPRHQTRFVYEIDKKTPAGGSMSLPIDGGDIPISDILVNLDPLLAGNPD
jgi:hypothetical protein